MPESKIRIEPAVIEFEEGELQISVKLGAAVLSSTISIVLPA